MLNKEKIKDLEQIKIKKKFAELVEILSDIRNEVKNGNNDDLKLMLIPADLKEAISEKINEIKIDLKNIFDFLNDNLTFSRLMDILESIYNQMDELYSKLNEQDANREELFKRIDLLIIEIKNINQAISKKEFKFDFKELFIWFNAWLEKIIGAVFKVNADIHTKPENALAVKIFDGKNKIVDQFGGIASFPLGSGGDSASADNWKISSTPTIYNITMTNANTEYSQALPAGTKKFTWQCRTAFDVRFAFVTGKVATPTAPYMTLKSGAIYYEDGTNLTSITLYLACGTAGKVVELICYT